MLFDICSILLVPSFEATLRGTKRARSNYMIRTLDVLGDSSSLRQSPLRVSLPMHPMTWIPSHRPGSGHPHQRPAGTPHSEAREKFSRMPSSEGSSEWVTNMGCVIMEYSVIV